MSTHLRQENGSHLKSYKYALLHFTKKHVLEVCHRAEIAVWALCQLVALYQEPLSLQGETHLPVSTCSRCLCSSSALCGHLQQGHSCWPSADLYSWRWDRDKWLTRMRLFTTDSNLKFWFQVFLILKITPVQFPRNVQLISKFLGRIFKQRPMMSLNRSDIKICLFSFENLFWSYHNLWQKSLSLFVITKVA